MEQKRGHFPCLTFSAHLPLIQWAVVYGSKKRMMLKKRRWKVELSGSHLPLVRLQLLHKHLTVWQRQSCVHGGAEAEPRTKERWRVVHDMGYRAGLVQVPQGGICSKAFQEWFMTLVSCRCGAGHAGRDLFKHLYVTWHGSRIRI